MEQTLLQMVQNILSRMDSDEINSYADTAESRQVANIIRNTYFNLFARANLPEHQGHFSLTSSADTDLPCLMTRPSDVARIDWIKYDKSLESVAEPSYADVFIIPIRQFLTMTHALNPDDDGVETMTVDSQTYLFRTNMHPTYCTVYKDLYVIFDSIDLDEDTTLQTSKTQCFGQLVPEFTLSDAFIPSLDEKNQILLLEESTATAFAEMKQTVNEKAERNSRRGWTSLQKSKALAPLSDFDALPSFGRR